MAFVVDASIALSWCFDEESTPYTVWVLDALREGSGVVPAIWPFEIADSLASGERRGRLTSGQVSGAIMLLQELPIVVDEQSLDHVWTSVLDLARSHRLTAYDASYLDLALRAGAPLATLDARLRDAAVRAGVPLVAADGVAPS